jgi:hypothetical protein
MKPQNKKNHYQDKLDWDDMTHGEASHHIGKKTTERVHKSKKDYSRKGKSKKKWDNYDDDYGYYPDR